MAVVVLSARRVLRVSLGIVAGLLALHLAAWWVLDILEPTWTLRLFDVGVEMSIPTWFSQILLFAGGVAALAVAGVERVAERSSREWMIIAGLMVYASMDEGAAIHELAVEPFRDRLGTQGGMLHFAWVVPFGFLVLVLVAVLFRFWLELPPTTRLLTATAAVLYVAGAIGFEMAGAPMAADERITSVPYLLVMTIEEGLEMVGGSLFLYALLNHLQLRQGDDVLGFDVQP